jgi:hypothetical protein
LSYINTYDGVRVSEPGEVGMIVDDGSDVLKVGEIKYDGVRVRESGEVGMSMDDGVEVGNDNGYLNVVGSFGVGMPADVSSEAFILIYLMVVAVSPFLVYLAFKLKSASVGDYQRDVMMV